MIIVGAISAILNKMLILNLAATFLLIVPLGFGFMITFLEYMRGIGRENMVPSPFRCFKDYGHYLGTSALMTVFIFLWTLLLIVPGIIKGYAYAMTPYIMHDNPELSADDCINRSMEMMNGYKWKLFCLDLSFLGWVLLGIITLGIGLLWVSPYMECSHAKFYEELKGREVAE